MTARDALDGLLAAAHAWHASLPAMQDFAPWPTDLSYCARKPVTIPACELVMSDPGDTTPLGQTLRDALVAATPHVEWRLTYTEDEVGADFLTRFGWFELAGPTGHFTTHQIRMTVGYWGSGLFYPRHQHEAEELYSVVSGGGIFHLDDAPDQRLGSGDTRFHASWQSHALTTEDAPILTFVLWRGAGLGDNPGMTR